MYLSQTLFHSRKNVELKKKKNWHHWEVYINTPFSQPAIQVSLSWKHTSLKGCVLVLEIVFVGQCEVFVCLVLVHFFFFPLAAKLIGLQTGRQFFKKC